MSGRAPAGGDGEAATRDAPSGAVAASEEAVTATAREADPATAREAVPAPLRLDAWLALLGSQPGMPGVAIDREAERALLDLTRVAAHRSERIAGPITAYLVGLALADVRPADRAARIRTLVSRLEEEPGSPG